MDFVKSTIEVLQQPLWAIAIFIAALTARLLPKEWKVALGVQDIINKYSAAIGVTLIFTFIVILLTLIPKAYRLIQNFFLSRLERKRKAHLLNTLTYSEKRILGYYITRKTKSQQLNMNDAHTTRLCTYKIIYQASSSGNMGFFEGAVTAIYFTYGITDWAYDYLIDHQECLHADESERPKEEY